MSLVERLWHLLFAFGVPEVQESCGCGNPLLERRFVELHKRSGSAIRYGVAQCGRCRTIAWDAERQSKKTCTSGQNGRS